MNNPISLRTPRCIVFHALAIIATLEVTAQGAKPEAANTAIPFTVPGSASGTFELSVNGVRVPVVAYKDVHYAQFGIVGASCVQVNLTGPAAIESATVQPSRHGIRPVTKGSRCEFEIAHPAHLVVQVNHLEKLFLFAEPMEQTNVPKPGAAGVVDITSSGLTGDGITDATARIQEAIDSLPRNGTLYFPAGHYRSGTLRLRSDMTLHLAAGALLQAVDDHPKITVMPGTSDTIVFLYADHVQNVTVSGPGTIDANGYVVRRAYEKAAAKRKQAGRAVVIRNCQNVTLSGVTIRDSYSWNVHALLTESLRIQGVKVLSDVRLSNHDGLDIDRCRDVLVEDCFLFTEDDAISPKASNTYDVVENYTFRRCVIWTHKANGIRIGTESKCRVMRNLTFEDIDILMACDGIRIDCAEGARYENLMFRNIRIEGFLQFLDPRFERNMERPPGDASESIALSITGRTQSTLGKISGVVFDNVRWEDERPKAKVDIPDAVQAYAKANNVSPLVDHITFRHCQRAGKPVLSAADAGLSFPPAFVSEVRFE